MTKEELYAPELLARYVRVPEDDEDELAVLQSLYLPAAVSHICAQIGIDEDTVYSKPELCIAALALTAYLYDNRSMAADNDKINRVVDALINQHAINLL